MQKKHKLSKVKPAASRISIEGRLPLLESSYDGERETYLWPDTHWAAVPHLGRVHYRRALPELPSHWHEDAFEITYLREGNLSWEMFSHPLSLNSGNVLVVPPGIEHGGSWAMMQPCRLDFLQITPSVKSTLLHPLIVNLQRIAGTPFSGTYQVACAFDLVLAEVRRKDAWTRSAMEAAVVLLISEVLRAHASGGKCRNAYSDPVTRAIRAIKHDISHWFTIHELADLSGLRATQLQWHFRRETGQNINAFALDNRLSRACSLLEAGSSATDIAASLGFSSSQYFATAFKRHFGLSPREWRRR